MLKSGTKQKSWGAIKNIPPEIEANNSNLGASIIVALPAGLCSLLRYCLYLLVSMSSFQSVFLTKRTNAERSETIYTLKKQTRVNNSSAFTRSPSSHEQPHKCPCQTHGAAPASPLLSHRP